MISESAHRTTNQVSGLRLRVSDPSGRREFSLNDRRMTFGSKEECSVRIDDDSNQVHFMILKGEQGVAVRRWCDTVTLNGQPFQDAWLVAGDEIQCGRFSCEFLEPNIDTSANRVERRNAVERRDSVKRRTRSLVDAIRDSRNRIRRLELEKGQLETEVFGSREELKVRQEHEQLLLAQQQELKERLQSLQGELDERQIEWDQERKKSNADGANNVDRRRTIKARTRSLVTEIRRARQQIQELESKTDELKNLIHTLKDEITLREQREEAYCDQKEELDNQLRNLQDELTNSKQVNLCYAQIWSGHNDRLLQLFPTIGNPKEADFSKEYSDAILDEIENIAAAESEAQRIDAEKNDVLERCRNELDEKFQELLILQENLNSEQDSLESEKAQLASVKESLETEKSQLASERESLDSEMDEIVVLKERVDSEKSELEAQISEFESQVSVTEAELQLALENQAAKPGEECTIEQADELRQRCVELAEQLHETLLERNDLREKVEELVQQEIQGNDWERESSTDNVSHPTPSSFSDQDEMAIEAVDDDEWSSDSDYQDGDEDWHSSESLITSDGPISDNPTDSSSDPAQGYDASMDAHSDVDDGHSNGEGYPPMDGSNRPSGIGDSISHSAAYEPAANDQGAAPESDMSTAGDSATGTDEIEYSQVSSGAPIDTASILANLGVELEEEDDDEPMGVAPNSPLSIGPNTPSPESSMNPDISSPADGDSDDSMIQEYMAQLMNRVGGERLDMKPSEPVEPAPEPEPIPTPVDFEPEDKTPLSPEEFVPKSKQPDIDVNAFRSVANESARTAIEKHSSNSRKRDVANSLYGAICFMLAGTTLLFWSEYGDMTSVGAFVCYLFGMLWIAKPVIVNSESFRNFKVGVAIKTAERQAKKASRKKVEVDPPMEADFETE